MRAKMKLNIKYTGLDSTPAIQTYIEEAIGGLDKYLVRLVEKGAVVANVELARTTNHHQKGDVYHAECNLELPGRMLRSESDGSDPRVCVDEVVDRMKAEVKKYATIVRPQDSGGQAELRKLRGKD